MSPNLPRRGMLLAVLAASVATFAGARVTAALQRVSPYLTRAEAAAIVMLASPADLPRAADTPYADVLPDDWFAPALLGAAEIGGLMPDASGTRMRPFGSVNRGTFLLLLSRAFDLPPNRDAGFVDVGADSPFAQVSGIARTYPLFRLKDDATLEPERLLTRDEARAAMDAFLDARSHADNVVDAALSAAQSLGKVQLYGVISTKRTRVAFEGGGTPALVAASDPDTSAQDVRAAILQLVNDERAKAGVPPIRRNAALERSAQAYADEMDGLGFFGHVDPDGDTLKERVGAVGYFSGDYDEDCGCIKGYILGENLARGQRTAAEAMAAWMSSPSHRDMVTAKAFTDLGVGVRAGTWVQHFGGILVPGTE